MDDASAHDICDGESVVCDPFRRGSVCDDTQEKPFNRFDKLCDYFD
jgi:hypothetical protein